MQHKFSIELGHCYSDKITGFTGRAIAACVHITGCDQVSLARPGKDGAEGKVEWFDDKRLEPATEFEKLVLQKADNGATGTPPRRDTPK